MEEGWKRVLGIMAAILASRRLAHTLGVKSTLSRDLFLA